jgi:hypothetical protein
MLVELGNTMNHLIATAIIILCVFFPSMVDAHRYAAGNSDRNIDALISAPLLVTYVDDGAADSSVTNVDANSNRVGVVEAPIPSVRDIINLRQRAIPTLISHLDDTRLTSAKLCSYFPGGRSECAPVPVGYVCLDILMSIVRAPTIIRSECGDDGFGACIANGYYFRPDAYTPKGQSFIAHSEVPRVKSNWQRAYRKRRLKYEYPEWWKRRI